MSSLSITSIGGKRCTAVPRTSTSLSSSSQSTAQASSVASTTSTSNSIPVPVASSSSSVAATTTQAAATTAAPPSTTPDAGSASLQSPPTTSTPPPVETTAAQTTTPEVATTSPPPASSAPPPSTSAAETSDIKSNSPLPVPQTTPQATSSQAPPSTRSEPGSSSTQSVVASSILSTSPAATGTALSEVTGATSTHASTGALGTSSVASAATTTSPADSLIGALPASSDASSPVKAGAVAGGVVGGLAIFGLLAFLVWWLSRRKKRRTDSLLTPLTTPLPPDKSGYYGELDETAMKPTPITQRLKQRFRGLQRGTSLVLVAKLSSLKDTVWKKLKRDKSSSVNLDRGNSQFMEPIYQHSRSTSTASSMRAQQKPKERILDIVQNLKDKFSTVILRRPKQRRDSVNDPFAEARKIQEKKAAAASAGPDFEAFLSHQRRPSQSNDTTNGSLDLDFGNSRFDMAGTPSLSAKPTIPNLAVAAPAAVTVSRSYSRTSAPLSSIPQRHGPLATIIESPIPSRFPSIISNTPSSPSSNRSTMMTTVSDVTARSKKGRSDPFDLSPPDMSYLEHPVPNMALSSAIVGLTASHQAPGANFAGSDPFAPYAYNDGDVSPLTPVQSTFAPQPLQLSNANRGPTSTLLDELSSFKAARRSQHNSFTNTMPPNGQPTSSNPFIPATNSYLNRDSTASSTYSNWSGPGPDLGPGLNFNPTLSRIATGESGPGEWVDESVYVGSPVSMMSVDTGHSLGGRSVGKAM